MSTDTLNSDSELMTVKQEVSILQTKLTSMETLMSSMHSMLLAQSSITSTPLIVPDNSTSEDYRQSNVLSQRESTSVQIPQLI